MSRLLGSFRRAGLIGESKSPHLTAQGRSYQMQVVVLLLDVAGLCKAADLPPPEAKPARAKLPRRLGSSLFDCCNYAKMTLGRMVA